jgi:pimeloyl-ACP methyl ester carboxylesterase
VATIEAEIAVKAQYIEVQGRRVLVRFAGTGPAVLLLHQSPQTSRTMLAWITRLAQNYAVFAPDTPGFGASDPLPMAQPTIPDFATALANLIDALGLKKVMVYGVHTGAVTGMRLALDHPQHVAALVCDGYARFTTIERQKLLDGYLPPFEPQWDGGHLLWLFARFREQHLFFPWNTPTQAARMLYPAPSTARVHSDILDILDAGDGYRAGYRAPFLYDDATAAARLTVSAAILYRAEDVLAPHLERLSNLPACVNAERFAGGAPVLIEKSDALFAQHAASATVVSAEVVVSRAQSKMRRIFSTKYGTLSLILLQADALEAGAHAHLYLNEIGTAAVIPVDSPFGSLRIAVELPGHGASRTFESGIDESFIFAIAEALQHLQCSRVHIHTQGAAAALGCALAEHLGSAVVSVVFAQPVVLDEAEQEQFLSLLPDLTPHSTGAHLLAAWNWVRMKSLFWPWLPQDANSVRMVAAPAPLRIHQEALEVVRCGPQFTSLWQTVFATDVVKICQGLSCKVIIECPDDAELSRLSRRLAVALNMQDSEQSTASAGGNTSWLSWKN